MNKKNVGNKIFATNSSWNFSGDVYKNFDEHINKSIPLYSWSHQIGLHISDFFVKKKSTVIDLGCSTGVFIKKINYRHKKKNITVIAYDLEKNMVKKAKKNNKEYLNLKIFKKDITKIDFNKSDFITSYYTISFINPSQRQRLFNNIYKSLNWGGGFLFFDKVRAPDARFQDMMSQIYNEFKLNQKFSPNEIIYKSQSLKGILEPFSSKANFDLVKRAGFKDCMSVFKYICFEGFLAIK